MKNVIILGAKGMLGQYLVRAFSDEQVFAFDKDALDVTDNIKLKNKLGQIRPDVIIKAIGYNNVDQAETDPHSAEILNGKIVSDLAEICLDQGAMLVHYSSDYVFYGDKKTGYQEDDLPSPISRYGYSQLLGEEAAKSFKNKGLRYYTIRTSRLFGRPGASSSGKKSFIQLMLELSKTNKQIKAVDEEFSSPTYALDLAESTRKLVFSKQPSGIYHLVNQNACTWHELAGEIFDYCHFDVDLIPVNGREFPRQANRPAFSQLLNTKFIQLRPWQSALHDFLKNYKMEQ